MISGCAGKRGGPVPYNRADFVAPDLREIKSSAAHRLRPGDVVTITVFQADSFSGDRTVDATGRIQMPLIGAVDAEGKTSPELQAILTAKLASSYLRAPSVQVVIKEAKSEKVTVDGSVLQPGIYEIEGDMTLLQAVALARGPNPDANPKRVVIFRTIKGERQAAAFDLTTIRTGLEPDPSVYGDDIIVVDGSATRQQFRDVISSLPLLSVFTRF